MSTCICIFCQSWKKGWECQKLTWICDVPLYRIFKLKYKYLQVMVILNLHSPLKSLYLSWNCARIRSHLSKYLPTSLSVTWTERGIERDSLDFFFSPGNVSTRRNNVNFFAFIPVISPLILFYCDRSSPNYVQRSCHFLI